MEIYEENSRLKELKRLRGLKWFRRLRMFRGLSLVAEVEEVVLNCIVILQSPIDSIFQNMLSCIPVEIVNINHAYFICCFVLKIKYPSIKC